MDLMNQIMAPKGLVYQARLSEGVPYHIYTNKGFDGSLKGQKTRITPVYREFFAALDGKPWIQLQRWSSVWAGEREIKAENRRVLAAFLKEHPDWAESFTGVELKTFHPDGRQTISTLYTSARGYYEIASQP